MLVSRRPVGALAMICCAPGYQMRIGAPLSNTVLLVSVVNGLAPLVTHAGYGSDALAVAVLSPGGARRCSRQIVSNSASSSPAALSSPSARARSAPAASTASASSSRSSAISTSPSW